MLSVLNRWFWKGYLDGSPRASYVALAESIAFNLAFFAEFARGHGVLGQLYMYIGGIQAVSAAYNNVVFIERQNNTKLSSQHKMYITIRRAPLYLAASFLAPPQL